jgi:iron complex outermembrane receptor protein
VRGAVYKSFRAPGFNNTTRTYGASTPTIANPDLTPENLFGSELGVDYARGALSLSATYFQYDIQNMISTFRVGSYATAPALVRTICSSGGGANLTQCGGAANFYTNDQDGQSTGLELLANWKASKQWSFKGAYTQTSSKLTRKGAIVTDPINVQLAGVPQDVATLGASWTPNAAWKAHLQARYIGSMNIDTTSTPGVEYKQGDITVWDASTQVALSKSVDLSASVVNLLDTQYSENAYTYNQPWSRTLSMPRTLTLGLKMRF